MVPYGQPLHAPLHEKALLGCKRQDVLRINDARAGGLQTNGDVIMPSHDDLALTVEGNGARPTGDFDPLTHGQRRMPLYTDRHDQARGDGCKDGRSRGMDFEYQPAIGWGPV